MTAQPRPTIVPFPPPPPAPTGVLREVDPTAPVPAVQWLIPNLVAAGCVTLLAGEEGCGKSLFALQEASRVAHVIPTAIVDAENGQDEIQRRLAPLRCKPVVYEARGIDLDTNFAQIEGLARAGYTLLVLDTFQSMWEGNDQVKGQVKPLFEALRTLAQQYHMGILLLDHTLKGDKAVYAGTGAKGRTVEMTFTMAHGKIPHTVVLTPRKVRIGASPPTRTLVLHNGVFGEYLPPPPPTPATATPGTARAPRQRTTPALSARDIHKLVDQGTLSKRQGRRALEDLGLVKAPWWRSR